MRSVDEPKSNRPRVRSEAISHYKGEKADDSSCVGEERRLTEAAEAFRDGKPDSPEPLQLSFFDTHKTAMNG
jgi:hypothetical protein